LTTGWTWSEDGTELAFALHNGVKWNEGKPFTAANVNRGRVMMRPGPDRPSWDFQGQNLPGDAKPKRQCNFSDTASGRQSSFACRIQAPEMTAVLARIFVARNRP